MTIWSREHDSVTGIGYAEASVSAPEDPYPAMVYLEVESASVLPDDAREYALLLLAAAEVADQATDQMVAEVMAPSTSNREDQG